MATLTDIGGGFQMAYCSDTGEVVILSPQHVDGSRFLHFMPWQQLRHVIAAEITAIPILKADIEVRPIEPPTIEPLMPGASVMPPWQDVSAETLGADDVDEGMAGDPNEALEG